MKLNEYKVINEAFNNACKKMIDKGWQINGATMRGTQGETCKLDFTNMTGSKIVRIVMIDEYMSGKEKYGKYYEVREFQYEKGVDYADVNDDLRTLWNDDKHFVNTIASIKIDEF